MPATPFRPPALTPLAAALLLCAAANAQMHPLGAPWNVSTCDLAALPPRIAELNGACAQPGQQSCTVGCAAVLFPLLEDCQPLLNKLYDGEDGALDGEASAFSTAFTRCNEMPLPDLLQFLSALHDEDRCPDPALDGVGETEVKAPECQDRLDGRCEMTIGSGMFTCETDFCNTAYPPCTFAGQCDATCGYCDDEEGGHYRRELDEEPAVFAPTDSASTAGEERRALQMGHVRCDPAMFTQEATAVTEACCDGPEPYGPDSKCASGFPASCDAKCAVAFRPFYDQCQRFLAGQYSTTEMANYDQLYHTCSAALPTEPLLRAAIACTHPCAGVECGEHGACVGEDGEAGRCECEEAYSGEHCEVLRCPELPAVDGATIALSDEGRTEGSVATYSCDNGEAPQDGDAERVCQGDGSWSGTTPTRCGSTLHFKVWGGGGGGNKYDAAGHSANHAEGGAGGFIEGTYIAHSGEILTITVGAGGTSRNSGSRAEGAFPNGGAGCINHAAGAGGGSSYVQSSATDNQVILGAGGGGGGGGGDSSGGGGGGGGGTSDGMVGQGGDGCGQGGHNTPQCSSISSSDFNGQAGGGGGGLGTGNELQDANALVT
eukprot:SAG31_NODE_4835_length_2916_cov_5.045793_1_plen_603_part_00